MAIRQHGAVTYDDEYIEISPITGDLVRKNEKPEDSLEARLERLEQRQAETDEKIQFIDV